MKNDSKMIDDLLKSLEENSDKAFLDDQTSLESFSDFDFLKGRVVEPEEEDDLLIETEEIDEDSEQFTYEHLYLRETEKIAPSPAGEPPPIVDEPPPLKSEEFELEPDALAEETEESEELELEVEKSVEETEEPEENPAESEAQPKEELTESPWNFHGKGSVRNWSPGKFLDSDAFLGLDIGRRATKYVLARKKRGDRIIEAFGILNYPEGADCDYDNVAGRVIQLLKEHNLLKSVKLNLVLYHADVGIQRLNLPVLKKKELAEAITWSLKKKFESQEKAILTDFLHLGKKKNKGIEQVDVLGAIAPEKVVEDSIRPFMEEKVVPSALLPLPSALLSLYRAAHIQNEGECVAMVDIGAEKTMIAFIRNDNLEFSRMVPIGGDPITEGMTSTIFHEGRAFQLSPAEAERVKREFGFPVPGKTQEEVRGVPILEVGALMRPYLERLTSEIQRSIDYYKENYSVEKIDRVYLLGGTAEMKNLLDFMKLEIEEKLELFQFSTHFSLSMPSADAQAFHNRFLELAVAVGLAMRGKKTLNLLPLPLRRSELFKLQRRLLIYLSLLTLTAMIFISATSFLRVTSLKNEYLQMQLEYKKMLPRKHRYDVLLAEKQFLTRKKRIYQSELILDNPLPQILKMISNLFPSDMALTALSISHESMGMGGSRPPAGKSAKDKNKKKEKNVPPGPPVSYLHLHGVRFHPPPDEGIKLANFMLKLNQTGYFRHVSLLNQSFSEEKDEMRFEIVCEF